MKNYFDLKGQVAIVTGCSGGLGVQMAKALANQGCNIVPIARRMEKLEEVAKELREEFGVEVLPIRCDITKTEMVEDVVKQTMERFGRIDILINNAGTGAVAPAEDITDEQFDNEMQIDLFGTFKMARAVAKHAMIPAKYGRIINIASMYGLVGNKIAPCSPYHAAKGGVVNLSRGLAAADEGHARDGVGRQLCEGCHSRRALRQRGRTRFHDDFPVVARVELCQRHGDSRRWRLYLRLNDVFGEKTLESDQEKTEARNRFGFLSSEIIPHRNFPRFPPLPRGRRVP